MTYGDPNDSCLSLWNEEDGFYYDAISWGPGNSRQVPVRSLVGLIPLYATLTLEPGVLKRFPGFKKRMDWFIENRPDMASKNIANMRGVGRNDRKLLALASEERLKRILEKMLDETEFLGEHGIRTCGSVSDPALFRLTPARSLSRYHKEHPYHMTVNGEDFSVEYWPGDSHSGMFVSCGTQIPSCRADAVSRAATATGDRLTGWRRSTCSSSLFTGSTRSAGLRSRVDI